MEIFYVCIINYFRCSTISTFKCLLMSFPLFWVNGPANDNRRLVRRTVMRQVHCTWYSGLRCPGWSSLDHQRENLRKFCPPPPWKKSSLLWLLLFRQSSRPIPKSSPPWPRPPPTWPHWCPTRPPPPLSSPPCSAPSVPKWVCPQLFISCFSARGLQVTLI